MTDIRQRRGDEPTSVTLIPDDLRSPSSSATLVELANDGLGGPSRVPLPIGLDALPDRVALEIPGQHTRVWERQSGRYYRRVRDRADWGIIRSVPA